MQLLISQHNTHIIKYEDKYGITRRISSHDFFAGLADIADVMLESSARDAGPTADAMLSFSLPLSLSVIAIHTIHTASDTTISMLDIFKNMHSNF